MRRARRQVVAATILFVALSAMLHVTSGRAAGPATLPAAPPAGIDAPLWERMKRIDAKVGHVVDLTANFEQRKFTPLLK